MVDRPCFGKEGIKAFVHASRRLCKLRQNIDIDVRSDPDGVFLNYGPASIETKDIVFGSDIFQVPVYWYINFNATPRPSDEYKAGLGSGLMISYLLIFCSNWQPIGNSKPIERLYSTSWTIWLNWIMFPNWIETKILTSSQTHNLPCLFTYISLIFYGKCW